MIWVVGDGFWEGAGCFGGGSGFASVGGGRCGLAAPAVAAPRWAGV